MNLFTKRDLLYFLAGIAFFHTISHMMLPFFVPLPLEVGKFTITAAYNFWIIVGSGVLTVALLWWAKRTTY